MSKGESISEPSDPQVSPSEARPFPCAWQPITPGGVAAFSRATFGRLLFVQFIVALLVAASVLWFLANIWFPTLREAIRQLPETGAIHDQRLNSPRTSTAPLAESRFLTFLMDVEGAGSPRRTTDFRVEFRRSNFAICSFLGCHVFDYPSGKTVQFNQPELESWWAAWEPMIYTWIGLGIFVWLFATWLVLATLYCPVMRIYAFFKDRQITVVGSWKSSAACLLPGALLVAGSIVLYGTGVIDLVRLVILWVLHLIVGWVFVFVSPLQLPRASDALPPVRKNPFGTKKEKGPPPNPFTDSPTPPVP